MNSKIVWLCSWYPNETNPFDGDFIQRHADAVSSYHSIDVLYVHKILGHKGRSNYQSTKRNQQLTEHTFTYHVRNESFIYKLLGLWQYFLIHVRFFKKYGKPDLIHVQIPMKAGIIALFYKWFYKIPYIITEHYGIYNPNLDDHFKTRNVFYRFATKLILKHADVLTTVSKSLGEDMNHWVMKKEVVVIPNVVDTKLFKYVAPVQKNKFQFIHISNMIPLKNVEGIVDACEQLSHQRNDFKLLLVGKIEPSIYEFVNSKRLLNKVVFFEGEIAYNDVALKIQESDAMIIFSDSESQSCVVLESLCCGRPAIVTNVGGVKELIDDKNGYKINARNTDELTIKMKDCMDSYMQFNLPEISKTACLLYSYEHVGKQFIDCYKQVIRLSVQ